MKNVIIKNIIEECRNTSTVAKETMRESLSKNLVDYFIKFSKESQAYDLLVKCIESRYKTICTGLKNEGCSVETEDLALNVLWDTKAYFESFYMLDKPKNGCFEDIQKIAVEYLDKKMDEIVDFVIKSEKPKSENKSDRDSIMDNSNEEDSIMNLLIVNIIRN